MLYKNKIPVEKRKWKTWYVNNKTLCLLYNLIFDSFFSFAEYQYVIHFRPFIVPLYMWLSWQLIIRLGAKNWYLSPNETKSLPKTNSLFFCLVCSLNFRVTQYITVEGVLLGLLIQIRAEFNSNFIYGMRSRVKRIK